MSSVLKEEFKYFLLTFLINVGAGGPVTNGLIDTVFHQECFYNKSADVVLLLDGSGSVGDNTFTSQLEFAIIFARMLATSSAAGIMLSILQYSDETRQEIPLSYIDTMLEERIHSISFLGGATHTGRALEFVQNNVLSRTRGGEVPRVLVLLTDGQSQDEAIKSAVKLRESGVTIYTIGVTNLLNVHELHEISGNDKKTFTVESFEELGKPLVEAITFDMCTTDFRPGEPEILCGPDFIGVRAATKDPFDGFIFVKDQFHDEDCRVGTAAFKDPRIISLNIPFNKCNVRRYRSVEPRGIYVETTVIFMFHMTFMTKVDHMVEIKCFYMESDKTVSSPMEVSMIPTEFRERKYPMPICRYTLHSGSAEGPELDFAKLGEWVYHRWECIEQTETDIFGMLVHSCYVDNGQGKRVDVLDSKGCEIDPILLQTPIYDDNLRLASKPHMVFKYADRPVLQFQCQVTLCIKDDNGCKGITPPICPILHVNTFLFNELERVEASGNRTKREGQYENSERKVTLDVFTNAITIFEKDPPLCPTAEKELFGSYSFGLGWVSPVYFAILTSFNIVLSFATILIWIGIIRRQSLYKMSR